VLRHCLGEVHKTAHEFRILFPNFVGIDLIKFYIEDKNIWLVFFLAQYIEGEYKKVTPLADILALCASVCVKYYTNVM